MLKITFALDQENDGIEVRHDGKQVFWDNARDGWTSYFQHMPHGVPVLVEYDNGDPREDQAEDAEPADSSFEDDRDYPDGNGNDARLKRFLVDNSTDPRIREQGTEGLTLTGGEVYDLLFDVMDRFYRYGTGDVRERHGFR
jgi:hypothetical protein